MASPKNTTTLLPKDLDNAPIPVMAPGTIVNAAVGSASAATALPTGAELVEVATNTDCWIVFGVSPTAASTTSMFMPKGSVVYRVPYGATHLSHIRDAEDGRISITKLV